jgi:hypothetical protein
MRGEISAALRAEGPDGRKADGLFGTVFHIGEIRVLAGNEILLALPRGVYAQAGSAIDQVVERVLCSVLGKDVRARFVDKARIDDYQPLSPAPGAVQEAGHKSSALQDTRPQDVHPQDAGTHESNGPSSPADPYEEAKQDPVVQDLVRRGGQVTQVELSE